MVNLYRTLFKGEYRVFEEEGCTIPKAELVSELAYHFLEWEKSHQRHGGFSMNGLNLLLKNQRLRHDFGSQGITLEGKAPKNIKCQEFYRISQCKINLCNFQKIRRILRQFIQKRKRRIISCLSEPKQFLRLFITLLLPTLLFSKYGKGILLPCKPHTCIGSWGGEPIKCRRLFHF